MLNNVFFKSYLNPNQVLLQEKGPKFDGSSRVQNFLNNITSIEEKKCYNDSHRLIEFIR